MIPDRFHYFLDDFWNFENLGNIWTRSPPNYYQNASTNTRKIWEHPGNILSVQIWDSFVFGKFSKMYVIENMFCFWDFEYLIFVEYLIFILSYGLRPLPPAPFGSSDFHLGGLVGSNETLLAFGGCYLGGLEPPIWYPGDHFGTSGAPWGSILASRDHSGGPWERQDGHEGVRSGIFIDFGLIWGSYFDSFLDIEAWNFNLSSGLFPGHVFYWFLTRNLDVQGSQN